jgi:hypothetical protein
MRGFNPITKIGRLCEWELRICWERIPRMVWVMPRRKNSRYEIVRERYWEKDRVMEQRRRVIEMREDVGDLEGAVITEEWEDDREIDEI